VGLLNVTSWTEAVLLRETEDVDDEVRAALLRWAASTEASERALTPQTFPRPLSLRRPAHSRRSDEPMTNTNPASNSVEAKDTGET
jgi:hypothetical protein